MAVAGAGEIECWQSLAAESPDLVQAARFSINIHRNYHKNYHINSIKNYHIININSSIFLRITLWLCQNSY